MAQSKKEKFDCEDIEKRFHSYLDGRLTTDEFRKFEEHLDFCLPCDKKIEFEKKFKLLLKIKAAEQNYPSRLKEDLKKILQSAG